MDYKFFYLEMKEYLLNNNADRTPIVTNLIKNFVRRYFENNNKYVLSNSSDRINREYLYDVSVLEYNPSELIECNKNKFILRKIDVKAYLLLESELGGSSASSQQQFFKNVLYDYTKLLIGNSKNKIMIAGVSPFNKESKFLENRIDIMYELYKKSNCDSDMLVITIEGSHNLGNSRQVKLIVSEKTVNGFLFTSKQKIKY